MSKKLKNSKSSKKTKKVYEDPNDITIFASDDKFDENLSFILIEHCLKCSIFKAKAEEIFDFLQKEIPERNFRLILNNSVKGSPRIGSFEIGVMKTAKESEKIIWTGVEKGPPRKEKIPENYSEFIPVILKHLGLFR